MRDAVIPLPPGFDRARRAAAGLLLARREAAGHWTGRLSSSALSTATAMNALRLVDATAHAGRIAAGAHWLAATQAPDGGWGDTPESPPNLSTTLLAWSAIAAAGAAPSVVGRAADWIRVRTGDLSAAGIAAALGRIYGRDRTFSVPILTHVALCGVFGDPRLPEAWRQVPQLPFELAALPRGLFRLVDMQVVSYALPALIAIGQVRHALGGARGPLAPLRAAARGPTLRALEAIQPAGGGFLEATPLTSFVTMSLAGMGHVGHPVARRAEAFLVRSARADGSWPIDTNLATWVTTQSVKSLAAGGRLAEHLPGPERGRIRDWLLGQQWREVHPATGAAPGGWAWTDLSGGVPDADDTSGAIVALAALAAADDGRAAADDRAAAAAGLEWLANLANRDGGIPTFCRGWGRLPFDTSCPDITAHALQAADAWRRLAAGTGPAPRVARMVAGCRRYLATTRFADGSWRPLWFGNQHHPDQASPAFGTARVVLATLDGRGAGWLAAAMAPDGGVGPAAGLPPSIEETAVTVEALARVAGKSTDQAVAAVAAEAAGRGLRWLVDTTAEGVRFPASPIGLYFAKLWYDESLYPLAFTVAAFERAAAVSAEA